MTKAELEDLMTETTEDLVGIDEASDADAIINAVKQAIMLLDEALSETAARGIVSASEMSDRLLDVRLVLSPLVS